MVAVEQRSAARKGDVLHFEDEVDGCLAYVVDSVIPASKQRGPVVKALYRMGFMGTIGDENAHCWHAATECQSAP